MSNDAEDTSGLRKRAQVGSNLVRRSDLRRSDGDCIAGESCAVRDSLGLAG